MQIYYLCIMIKKVIAACIASVALSAGACENDSVGLVFDKKVHDMGTVSVNAGYITCTYTGVNMSDSTIVILGALSGCGCAVPTYPKDPIPPGGKATVSVTYDTLGRPDGEFEKEIVLHTTAPKPNITLILRGKAVK